MKCYWNKKASQRDCLSPHLSVGSSSCAWGFLWVLLGFKLRVYPAFAHNQLGLALAPRDHKWDGWMDG